MRSAACEACRGAFAAVISVVSTSDRTNRPPRAAAVRVQLVQGSSGTCFYRVQGRCMFLAVHSSPVACGAGGNRNSTLFTRYRKDPPLAPRPPTLHGRGPRTILTPRNQSPHPLRTGVWASRAFRQIGSRLRSYVPRSQSAARRPPLFLRSTALLAFSQISHEISHWSPWLGAEAIVVTSVVTSALARLGGGRWVGG